MLSLKPFAREVVAALDEHLVEQEEERGLVSQLAAGAAFEAWLAFETRLLIEQQRQRFGLSTARPGKSDAPWLVNERRKVDLFVGEDDGDTVRCLIAVEFKLIYNNKNWPSQVRGAKRDLKPAPGSPKAKLKPELGRVSVVALVGKVYEDGTGYPGMREDLGRWEREVWAALAAQTGRRPLRGGRGERHDLDHDWLLQTKANFFQLNAFAVE